MGMSQECSGNNGKSTGYLFAFRRKNKKAMAITGKNRKQKTAGSWDCLGNEKRLKVRNSGLWGFFHIPIKFGNETGKLGMGNWESCNFGKLWF